MSEQEKKELIFKVQELSESIYAKSVFHSELTLEKRQELLLEWLEK